MAKGGDSKREKVEAPPEILVWSPPAEQDNPPIEEQQTAPSPVTKKPRRDTKAHLEEASLDTSNDFDKNEVNHNDRYLGFFLIPCLVFSSVLFGLGSDFESIGCELRDRHTSLGTITLDGGDYDLYTFHYEDLENEDEWEEGDHCELSDWNIHHADEIELMVRTNQYNAHTSCSIDGNDCDGSIFEYGNDWIPMEERYGSNELPDGYFAFEDGGWLDNGYFAVAVKPSVELSEFEARATSGPSVPQLIFSIVLTPAALFFANRWAVANDRPDLRAGAIAFAKITLKAAVVFGFLFMCLIFLILMTW